MRIGVDVGGTNTDAVIMRGAEVVGAVKSPTTADVGGGIVAAVGDVLAQAGIAPGAIESVMIGTTQFTNAFVERRRLVEVGVIRLALPATSSLPPLVDWPPESKTSTTTRWWSRQSTTRPPNGSRGWCASAWAARPRSASMR